MKNSPQHEISVAISCEEHMDLSQIQLIYRAEGNANLVLALPEFKKVIRLPKANIGMPVVAADMDTKDQSCVESADHSDILNLTPTSISCNESEYTTIDPQDHLAFVKIIKSFLGHEYIFDPVVVKISNDVDRLKIKRLCEPFRPSHRLDKEFCGQFGLLLNDATLLPDVFISNLQLASTDTFALEIKPKQGWILPRAASIFDTEVLPEKEEAETFMCRYCAMQYSKLIDRKITKLSAYCPIDLFSGKSLRMRNALDALFDCCQNNLRIFQNGNLIFGDYSGSMSLERLKETIFAGEMFNTIQCLVVRCLLKDYTAEGRADADPPLSCDSVDIAGKAKAKAKTDVTDSKILCLPRNCVLEKILQLQMLAKKNLHVMSMSPYSKWNKKTYYCLKNLLQKHSNMSPMDEYLLGATALDCSIIISFREIQMDSLIDIQLLDHPNVISLPEFRKAFVTKVTVVDLDPKPDYHFHKYVCKTNEAYRNVKCKNQTFLCEQKLQS